MDLENTSNDKKEENLDLNSPGDLILEQEQTQKSIFATVLLLKMGAVDFTTKASKRLKDITNYDLQVIVVDCILKVSKESGLALCVENGVIYAFGGSFWEAISIPEMNALLFQCAVKLGVEYLKASHFTFIENLLAQFMAHAQAPVKKINKNTVKINLNNITLVVSNGVVELQKFDLHDFLKYKCCFNYNPDAKAPLFLKSLGRSLPNEETQAALAEYIATVFLPKAVFNPEKFLLLLGPGGNGKSLVCDIITALLGHDNVSSFSLNLLAGENAYYRAAAGDKLLNFCSEMGLIRNVATFKQLVSQERVDARMPYGIPYNLDSFPKLIMNANEYPKDTEISKAFFRRIMLIEFKVIIPEEEQDKTLASKIIQEELSGVLNWILAGLLRVLKNKNFTYSKDMLESLEEYKKQLDNTRLFIDEWNYRPSTSNTIKSAELYYNYRVYCNDSGFNPLNRTNFVKRLINAGYTQQRKEEGQVMYIEPIPRQERPTVKEELWPS